MSLPKPKTKKLINEKEFAKNAKKVKQSFEEEAKYLLERKLKHGDSDLSTYAHFLS